ncbi:MAG: radical SAM protein [Candidatus Omnitrophica bacterium]|jgi:wyosine [tRNA(Phe)-imidazoG37] synthetase (radical SAM superfamily)|nr:radical SAM protein [Candidatus Omnitrophota bacterium]
MTKFKYIYGPVSSWRLGSSLGIDLLSGEKKICSFNCIYCQLGKKIMHCIDRKNYIPAKKVLEELKKLPNVDIDYYTFSGRGEPTLAVNTGKIAKWIKENKNGKTALLTNSSTILDRKIWKDIQNIDFIAFKIDAYSEDVFKKINRPIKGIKIENIRNALLEFRKIFKGKFTVQIMVLKENLKEMEDIKNFCKILKPDEIQLNTPLRPSGVQPVSKKTMEKVKKIFKGLPVSSVYDINKKKVEPISTKDTMKRRGKKI